MEKIDSVVDLWFSKREHESDFTNVDHVYHDRFRSSIVTNRSPFLAIRINVSDRFMSVYEPIIAI